jgi:hypothetical protein
VTEREVEALLAQPDLQELVQALREFEELPEAERLRLLGRRAWHVRELALADGDWRAAAFFADQIARRHNPDRTLARGVINAQARAATTAAPPKEAKARPPTLPRPYKPVAAALRRAAASLRAATLHEAVAVCGMADPVPTVATTPPAPLRRLGANALADRLRAGTCRLAPADNARAACRVPGRKDRSGAAGLAPGNARAAPG